MEKFHGFVVEESLKESEVLSSFEILGRKSNHRTIVKIAIEPYDIRNGIRRLQSNLKQGYFFHVYKDDKMIVVFKDRQFWISTDRETWEPAIRYGLEIGLSKEELDFKPTKLSEEDF